MTTTSKLSTEKVIDFINKNFSKKPEILNIKNITDENYIEINSQNKRYQFETWELDTADPHELDTDDSGIFILPENYTIKNQNLYIKFPLDENDNPDFTDIEIEHSYSSIIQ